MRTPTPTNVTASNASRNHAGYRRARVSPPPGGVPASTRQYWSGSVRVCEAGRLRVGMAPVDEAEFRADARAWLAEHAPATRAQIDAATTDVERFEASRAWQRTLFDGGWAGITWPVEFGGRGGTAREASIF